RPLHSSRKPSGSIRKTKSHTFCWLMRISLWGTLERLKLNWKPIASLVRPMLQVLPRRRVHRPRSSPTRDGVFARNQNVGCEGYGEENQNHTDAVRTAFAAAGDFRTSPGPSRFWKYYRYGYGS